MGKSRFLCTYIRICRRYVVIHTRQHTNTYYLLLQYRWYYHLSRIHITYYRSTQSYNVHRMKITAYYVFSYNILVYDTCYCALYREYHKQAIYYVVLPQCATQSHNHSFNAPGTITILLRLACHNSILRNTVVCYVVPQPLLQRTGTTYHYTIHNTSTQYRRTMTKTTYYVPVLY